MSDWEEALHSYECYDVAGDAEEILGELVMDIAAPLPTSEIHPDELEFAHAILAEEDVGEAIDWLRENRMNTHVVAHGDSLHECRGALEKHIGLDADHGMSLEALIGQAVLKDFTDRVVPIEGVKEWLAERKEQYKAWRGKRKEKREARGEEKEERRRGEYQTKSERAKRKKQYYKSKMSDLEEDKRKTKWYQFLKKRKLRKKESRYTKEFGRAAAKRQRYKLRGERPPPPPPPSGDGYGYEENYFW
jgi:hypothetical protein